jgi:protein involved in ribonucleotide reduction
MSKITEAVSLILLRTFVPEMEKLQPSEQVEVMTQIIRYMANNMNRLYMDGIINAKREASAELEEEGKRE